MSHTEFFKQALDFINKATAEDNSGNYEQAYRYYESAVQYFLVANKYERNESMRDMLKKRVTEYMNRMEVLRDAIQQKGAPSNNGGGGGSASMEKSRKGSSGGGGGGGEDKETDRLKSNLASTILAEKPNVTWDDVAGLECAKEALKEAVILPIKFPHLFTGQRTPWRGILLYGPPGTGKTFLAKAVATEANASFMSVSSSDLVSKWVGESEKYVKQMFEVARQNKPCIIFIDEIDSMCGSRGEGENEASRRMKTEFLVQMNGVGNDVSGILVLGATNLPWTLDSAIRRRFEKRIYIPLPDVNSRTRMFQNMVKDTPNALTLDDMRHLGKITERYSGADISTVVRDALMQPVRKVQSATHFKEITAPDRQDPNKTRTYLTPCSPGDAGAFERKWTDLEGDELWEPELTVADFLKSLQTTRPTVSDKDIQEHVQFTKDFGQEG